MTDRDFIYTLDDISELATELTNIIEYLTVRGYGQEECTLSLKAALESINAAYNQLEELSD